jgi:hypothetical protein
MQEDKENGEEKDYENTRLRKYGEVSVCLCFFVPVGLWLMAYARWRDLLRLLRSTSLRVVVSYTDCMVKVGCSGERRANDFITTHLETGEARVSEREAKKRSCQRLVDVWLEQGWLLAGKSPAIYFWVSQLTRRRLPVRSVTTYQVVPGLDSFT